MSGVQEISQGVFQYCHACDQVNAKLQQASPGRTTNGPYSSGIKFWVTHQKKNQEQLRCLLKSKGMWNGWFKKVAINASYDHVTSSKDCNVHEVFFLILLQIYMFLYLLNKYLYFLPLFILVSWNITCMSQCLGIIKHSLRRCVLMPG